MTEDDIHAESIKRVADGEAAQLVITYEDGGEWECADLMSAKLAAIYAFLTTRGKLPPRAAKAVMKARIDAYTEG